MVNVRHVVVLLEALHQLLDRLAALGVELLGIRRQVDRLTRDNLPALVVEPLLDGAERLVGGVYRHTLLVGIELVDTQVDGLELELLHVGAGRSVELEDALVLKHESHRAAVAQRTAALVEVHAHVGHRTVRVVGCRLHQEGDSVGAVAFVDNLLVVGGVLLGGTLDGALDVLLGHVLGLGVLNQNAQTRVARRVGTSGLHGDFNLLADFGERAGHVTPALQLACFAIFKGSSHRCMLFVFYFSFRKSIKFLQNNEISAKYSAGPLAWRRAEGGGRRRVHRSRLQGGYRATLQAEPAAGGETDGGTGAVTRAAMSKTAFSVCLGPHLFVSLHPNSGHLWKSKANSTTSTST